MRLKLLLITAFLLLSTTAANAMSVPKLSAGEESKASKLYFDKCSHCHGKDGAGDGYAVTVTRPVPRDFTSCQWKFRRTKSLENTQPTLEDLYLSITHGMPGTSMPAWGGDGVFIQQEMIPEADRWLLAKYIMRFCDTMADPEEAEPVKAQWPTIGEPTPDVLALGEKKFNEICSPCHGVAGRGNGPQAAAQIFDISPKVQEALGVSTPNIPIWPRNLRKPWIFRNGSTAEDIYRTITTGLVGSPMSSFQDQLSDEERIAVASYVKWKLHYPDYIRDLKGRKDSVTAAGIPGEIPLDPTSKAGKKIWGAAEDSAFPLIAQIIAPPRKFWTSNDLVQVKAVYNKNEVGVYVRWDDPTGPNLDTAPPVLTDADEGKIVVLPKSGQVTRGQSVAFKAFRYEGGKLKEVEATWSLDNPAAKISETGEFSSDTTGSVTIKASVDGKDGAGALLVLEEDVLHVQVPTQFYEGAEKPHFLNGDSSHPVHLWTISGESPDQMKMIKSAGHFLKDQVEIEGGAEGFKTRAYYQDGQWHVVIVRPRKMKGKEPQIPFEEGVFVPIAFNTTDGNQGDSGMQKDVSPWFAILLKPPPDDTPKAAGLMGAGIAFLLLIITTLIIQRAARIEEAAKKTAI